MNPIDRIIFVGGTFSVGLYAKVHNIRNWVVIKNGFNLLAYHNSKPVFIMEDAPDIYGSELHSIVEAAQSNGYLMIQLSYKDPFPTDDDIEEMREHIQLENKDDESV